MKIAWCLYGQPRLFHKGYENIFDFLNNNPNIDCDFFMHRWFNEKQVGNYYACSYRNLSKEELLIKPNTDFKLINLYKPKSYLFEESKNFDISLIQSSLMNNYTKDYEKLNYNNVLSNLFSKFKVNELLQNYSKDNNIKYDLVISTRYDYLNKIIVDIKNINADKLNIIFSDNQRIILNDSFIITNTNLFDIYSKAFNNIENIINNNKIITECIQLTHCSNFVPETVLLSNLLYNKINILNTIEYRKDMLNFT